MTPAAHAAGIPVLVTTSWFTKTESFSSSPRRLGFGRSRGEQSRVNENRIGRPVGEYVKLEDLAASWQRDDNDCDEDPTGDLLVIQTQPPASTSTSSNN
jgi:hypothetical protein